MTILRFRDESRVFQLMVKKGTRTERKILIFVTVIACNKKKKNRYQEKRFCSKCQCGVSDGALRGKNGRSDGNYSHFWNRSYFLFVVNAEYMTV